MCLCVVGAEVVLREGRGVWNLDGRYIRGVLSETERLMSGVYIVIGVEGGGFWMGRVGGGLFWLISRLGWSGLCMSGARFSLFLNGEVSKAGQACFLCIPNSFVFLSWPFLMHHAAFLFLDLSRWLHSLHSTQIKR